MQLFLNIQNTSKHEEFLLTQRNFNAHLTKKIRKQYIYFSVILTKNCKQYYFVLSTVIYNYIHKFEIYDRKKNNNYINMYLLILQITIQWVVTS
jgi:hypothetical protein